MDYETRDILNTQILNADSYLLHAAYRLELVKIGLSVPCDKVTDENRESAFHAIDRALLSISIAKGKLFAASQAIRPPHKKGMIE